MANTVPVAQINKERLRDWQGVLNKQHATAMILIAVGHDAQKGEVHVLTPEGVSDRDLATLALAAAERLAEGRL